MGGDILKEWEGNVSAISTWPRKNGKLIPKPGYNKTLLSRQIEATDAAIDKLVYELYGLTPEEIAIVEGGGK